MEHPDVYTESYISKDLARDKNRKSFVKDVYSIRVRHAPTGTVVEMEESLPRDSRKWTEVCLQVRERALGKLSRLMQQ
jgi:hypothetical protein